MFTVTFNLLEHPQDTLVTFRSVTGIDLTEKGGYALTGDWVKSTSNQDRTATTENPLVVMIKIGEHPNMQRIAVLIIPTYATSSNNFSYRECPSLDLNNSLIKANVSVIGDGAIYGVYTDFEVQRVQDVLKNTQYALRADAPSYQNAYYQVALDLHALNQAKFVHFAPDKEGVVYKHITKVSIHGELPSLPSKQYKWGPEIAGIMTVSRRDKLGHLYPITVLLEEEENLSSDLINFIKSQSVLLDNLAQAYKVTANVYGKDIKDE